jgi:hypothetical protein
MKQLKIRFVDIIRSGRYNPRLVGQDRWLQERLKEAGFDTNKPHKFTLDPLTFEYTFWQDDSQ